MYSDLPQPPFSLLVILAKTSRERRHFWGSYRVDIRDISLSTLLSGVGERGNQVRTDCGRRLWLTSSKVHPTSKEKFQALLSIPEQILDL